MIKPMDGFASITEIIDLLSFEKKMFDTDRIRTNFILYFPSFSQIFLENFVYDSQLKLATGLLF